MFERFFEQFSNNFDTLLGQKFQETIIFVSSLNRTANQFHIEANSKNAESSEENGLVQCVLKQLNFRVQSGFPCVFGLQNKRHIVQLIFEQNKIVRTIYLTKIVRIID